MADIVYMRGWDDCLEVISNILLKAKTVKDAERKISKLQEIVKEDKFEKIRYDLGVFNIF